jgi:hypothetical protein
VVIRFDLLLSVPLAGGGPQLRFRELRLPPKPEIIAGRSPSIEFTHPKRGEGLTVQLGDGLGAKARAD